MKTKSFRKTRIYSPEKLGVHTQSPKIGFLLLVLLMHLMINAVKFCPQQW
jgi:hypothetical protein